MKVNRSLLIVGFVVMAIAAVVLWPRRTPITFTADQQRLAAQTVDAYKTRGLVRSIDCAKREAMIHPGVWADEATDSIRELLTTAIAVTCWQPNTEPRIDVIDPFSGKRLAHVGPLGYRVN